MANHFNPEVFSDGELEIIITAATRLTELLRKSQSFDSDLEMYEKFDEWALASTSTALRSTN